MPELTTAPVETAIDAADELYFNDVSETPDAVNRITYANFNGANLSAIKGLTSAADKGIQFTGAGTAAVFDLTAAGKALLDDVDAAAQRTTLGLVIGTNVQAFDAFLDDIAALTDPGADRLMFWDDSAGEIVWLTLGTNLSITATTIDAAGGGGITNSAGANVIPKSDGTNIVASSFSNAAADILTGSGSTALELSSSGGAIMRYDANNRVAAGGSDVRLVAGGGVVWWRDPGTGAYSWYPDDDNTRHLGSAAKRWQNAYIGEFYEGTEMTAPAAPAANKFRLFAVDNGSGKTVLQVIFSSGAAQQIAIQP